MPRDAMEASPLNRIVGVIPARLQSHRLPRKVLREIAGKPLLAWVYQAALACPQFDEVVVAADSDEVADLCHRNGWRCLMTSPALPSGTDRLYVVSQQIAAEVYVNIQGDEPLIMPSHIAALLRPFQNPSVDVSTLKTICTPEERNDPNAVKVVTASDGRALYFSRATIPYDRDGTNEGPYWKHLGLYAYRRAALARFAALSPGLLEQVEKLEQLRLLENGMSLYVEETRTPTIGVDTEADLHKVEALLLERTTEGRA